MARKEKKRKTHTNTHTHTEAVFVLVYGGNQEKNNTWIFIEDLPESQHLSTGIVTAIENNLFIQNLRLETYCCALTSLDIFVWKTALVNVEYLPASRAGLKYTL